VPSAFDPAAVLEGLTDFVAVLDTGWHFTYLNQPGARFLGFRPEDLIGRELWELFPGARASDFYQRCQQAVQDQQPFSLRHHSPQRGVWLDLRISPSPAGITIFGRDVTEQQRVESALRASEERLRLAQQAGHIGTWDWDLVEDQVSWSDGTWKLLGLPPRSTGTGREVWFERIYPDDRGPLIAEMERVLAEGIEFSQEFRVIRADDAIRWLVSQGQVIRDEQGRAIRFLGVNIDITDRKRSEQALAESEARLRFTTEALPQVIWLAAPDGSLVDCNRHWYELTGLSVAETLNGSWVRVLHPDDLAELERTWPGFLAAGEPYEFEYRIRRAADGAYRWHTGRSMPIRDDQGVINRWLGTAFDIQRLKDASEIERRGEQLYRAFLEQGGEAFWFTDLDGRCLELNEAACQLLGYEREELLGSVVRELFHPEDQPARLDDLQRVHTGYTVRAERRLRRKDGVYVTVEGIARAFDATRTLVFFRDVTRRRAAEDALRVREQEFRAIFELAAVGATQSDPHTGRFRRVNRKLCDLTGYSEAELLDLTFFALTHPDDQERNQEVLDQLLRGDRDAVTIEKRYLRKDGTVIWVQTDATLLRGADGAPLMLLAVVQDITAAYEAREALVQSERALREAQRVARLGSWSLDLLTGNAWWSEEMYRLYQLDPAEIQPSLAHSRALIHPQDWPKVEAQVREAMEQGAGFQDLELRFFRADGSVGWMLTRGEVERDAGGKPVRLIGSSVDITERKEAEQGLREREERLRLATRAAGIGTFDWDLPSGRIVWTEQEELLFGLEPGTFGGTIESWKAQVLPDDREEMERRIRECTQARREDFDFAFRIRRPDGEVRWIEGASRFVYAEDGTPLRMVGVNLDATERRLLAEAREARAQALAEESRRKDEFLAMLAHELRNPLAPITNAAHLLQFCAGDPEQVGKHRETVERNARHLSRLVDDLLEVARINEGKIDLRREAVDLAEVLRQASASVRPRMEQRQHELTLALPPQPVPVLADPVRLVQVVVNLLTNAAKYTEPGGRITVELEGPDSAGAAAIRVRDNGRGIDPELLPQVFELFVQGSQTLARTEGGLGVGLTLAQRLVEMHGGTLTAQSEGPGRGSEFIVRLPTSAERAAEPVRPLPTGLGGTGTRLLLVEDNVDAAETLAELLELWGLEARVTHTGAAALEVAASFHPQVVLLDLGLPGMDGYEVAARLRALLPTGTPPIFVALTGYGDAEHRRRTTAAGFDHHLVKPVEPEVLRKLVCGGGGTAGAEEPRE
jgi:PAS domain S-box-containing protein